MAKKYDDIVDKTNAGILKDVKAQLELTLARVDKALEDTRDPHYQEGYPSRSFASAKRSALDLKNELTKLTQSSKYKYNRP